MKLADKPYQYHYDSDGLTFKERLVIALASNPVLFQDGNGRPYLSDDNCKAIVAQADAIIAELEKEK